MSKAAFRSWPVVLFAGLVVLAIATIWRWEPRVGRLWVNTACLAAGSCLVALPLGILSAVAIFKTDVPGRGLVRLLFVGMLFLPLYVIAGAWDAGFGIQGWHTLATNPHLAHEPWLAGWRAAIWIHGIAAVPWVALIVGAGLRAVEAEVEEEAATCASPARVMWHISLRRAAPAIVVAAVCVAIVTSVEISVTDFFQVRTFAEEVYTQAALGTWDVNEEQVGPPSRGGQLRAVPLGSRHLQAAGLWSGLLLSAALALVAIAAAGRLFADLLDVPLRPPWIWRLGRLRWPAAAALWGIVMVVAGLPLANLVYKAGVHVTTTETTRVRSWSAGKALERIAAAPVEFRGDLALSVMIGVAAATAAVAIALPLAWSMRRSPAAQVPAGREITGRPWIRLALLALCLTIPGPLLGMAMIDALNQPPDSMLGFLASLYDTNFAPWLVQTIRALPLVTLVLWPALASVPQVMLDTAAVDGIGYFGRMWRIALPQRWSAVFAAWLVGLAIAVSELAATVLVLPPQRATAISVRVFQLLHYGVDDRVAAICLMMVTAIAAMTGIAAALWTRKMWGR